MISDSIKVEELPWKYITEGSPDQTKLILAKTIDGRHHTLTYSYGYWRNSFTFVQECDIIKYLELEVTNN